MLNAMFSQKTGMTLRLEYTPIVLENEKKRLKTLRKIDEEQKKEEKKRLEEERRRKLREEAAREKERKREENRLKAIKAQELQR